LTGTSELNVIKGIQLVTCSQQFAKRWWQNRLPKKFTGEGGPVDTWYSTQNCMQQLENPNSPYLRSGNIIRSIYADESQCSSYWANYINAVNWDMDLVGEEIRRRMSEYFGFHVPTPLSTHCQVSGAGWHFLSVNATFILGNNPHIKIEDWAQNPIIKKDTEFYETEDIFVCGDAYHVRHGWIDGARSSCDYILHNKFGISKSVLKQLDFSIASRAQCSSFCNNVNNQENCDFPPEAILKPE
jgi:hypothetical protein